MKFAYHLLRKRKDIEAIFAHYKIAIDTVCVFQSSALGSLKGEDIFFYIKQEEDIEPATIAKIENNLNLIFPSRTPRVEVRVENFFLGLIREKIKEDQIARDTKTLLDFWIEGIRERSIYYIVKKSLERVSVLRPDILDKPRELEQRQQRALYLIGKHYEQLIGEGIYDDSTLYHVFSKKWHPYLKMASIWFSHRAAAKGRVDILSTLLELSSSEDSLDQMLDRKDRHGRTALQRAILKRQVPSVRFLLELIVSPVNATRISGLSNPSKFLTPIARQLEISYGEIRKKFDVRNLSQKILYQCRDRRKQIDQSVALMFEKIKQALLVPYALPTLTEALFYFDTLLQIRRDFNADHYDGNRKWQKRLRHLSDEFYQKLAHLLDCLKGLDKGLEKEAVLNYLVFFDAAALVGFLLEGRERFKKKERFRSVSYNASSLLDNDVVQSTAQTPFEAARFFHSQRSIQELSRIMRIGDVGVKDEKKVDQNQVLQGYLNRKDNYACSHWDSAERVDFRAELGRISGISPP